MSDRTPLDVEALRGRLDGRWSRVDVVAETASTNADLLHDHAAPDRSVLVAEHQVAGRGRLDRTWTSPPGAGLTFSVLLRPEISMLQWTWLPLLAGLAVHEALAEIAVRSTVKWPNDVLAAPAGEAEYGKVAGVLSQATSDGDAVVLGIGLNVSTTRDELPAPTATSLALCGVPEIDRGELLVSILTRLDGRYSQWADCDGDAEACGLAAAYRAACSTIGQLVSVTGAAGVLEGRAIGVDITGRLVIQTADGEQAVGAGDVEHVRPA